MKNDGQTFSLKEKIELLHDTMKNRTYCTNERPIVRQNSMEQRIKKKPIMNQTKDRHHNNNENAVYLK